MDIYFKQFSSYFAAGRTDVGLRSTEHVFSDIDSVKRSQEVRHCHYSHHGETKIRYV